MSRERLEPAAMTGLERQLRMAGASSSQAKPTIQPIGASPLLSQLKQFLPKMQQANVELQQKLQECDPAELDIEHIPEQGEEGQVIQMDLACGLLELKDPAAVAAAQRAIAAGGDITVETYDGGSGSDIDSDDSSDESESEDLNEGLNENGGSDVLQGVTAALNGEVAGSSRSTAAAAAAAAAPAAAAADMDSMDEDCSDGQAAAADSEQQQQQQTGQQQQGKQRRKLKAKKPMIVELA